MHFEHDHHSFAASGHVINVYSSTILHAHAIGLAHHQHGDYHSAVIDISSDNLIKKASSLNPLLLIFLFIGLLLCVPRQFCMHRQRLYKILLIPGYYLLQPPLRAPPVK
jgi:hypothetical protein